MNKQVKAQHRADYLVFDTSSRLKRLVLTLVEFASVIAVLFVFCYVLYLVGEIA